MIYREYLVMRKAVAWFAGVMFTIELISFILSANDNAKLGLGSIALSAGVFAAVFAWIFGVSLGNGSREASRVLWVLPGERWKLALQVIAVDLAGVTVAFACEFAFQLVFLALAGMRFRMEGLGAVSASDIALTLALGYATYGWSVLVGMLGRRVPYSGLFAAPILIVWFTLAQQHFALSAFLRAPIVANPIAVFNTAIALEAWQLHHDAVDPVSTSLQWLGTTWETPVLFAIAVATCGLAVALWQRAEVTT